MILLFKFIFGLIYLIFWMTFFPIVLLAKILWWVVRTIFNALILMVGLGMLSGRRGDY